MKLFITKLICLVVCVPVYPLVLFAEYYDKKTSAGVKIRKGFFKEKSKDYWLEVWEVLTYKRGKNV